MNPELLLTFFILCSALPTTLSRALDQSDFQMSPLRMLTQKIIDQETKKVEKAVKNKKTFQSYHFPLQPTKNFIEFYMDPMTEQEIQGHVNIMWKHKNAFLLPNILKSQKIKLEIYENEDRILRKSFYTKAAFRFDGEQDKLYKIKISHKNQQPLVQKLITLNIENFFEQFNEIQQQQDEIKIKKKSKSKKKVKLNKYLADEDESQMDEVDEVTTNDQSKKSRKEKSADEEQKQKFELWMVSERLNQFLIEMKLIINEAQTKHLAEYTIQKFIENSIQIYWQYELFECLIVIICTFVQIILVNRLLHSNKILV